MDASEQLPLNPLEFRILLVLLDGPSHGYEIVRQIEERERFGSIYPANLYRRIRDLLDRGLIEEQENAEERGLEARRRNLAITRFGRAVARAEARRLAELVSEATERKLLTS